METNIFVTLRCKTKQDGQDYYGIGETFSLAAIDPIIGEFRNKLLAMKPMQMYGRSEWYKDMYIHERYLFDKNCLDALRSVVTELKNYPTNPGNKWDKVIDITLDGLDDWVPDGSIVLGEKVLCTDPCYDVGTWCTALIEDTLPGVYECAYQREIGEERIATIRAIHKDYVGSTDFEAEPTPHDIGVDSGQAGIFDLEYYAAQHEMNEERFYELCCDTTYREWDEANPDYLGPTDHEMSSEEIIALLNKLEAEHPGLNFDKMRKYLTPTLDCSEMAAGVVPDGKAHGYVASSGFGDGSYRLFVAHNTDGKVIGFKIVFIDIDDFEEEG